MIAFSSLGFLDPKRHKLIRQWCREQVSTLSVSPSTYVIGVRHQKWFEKGWNLGSAVEVFDAAPSEPMIYQLGQELFPGNDSCLFLRYHKGAYIKPHRDHTASENRVVQINLGCTVIFRVDSIDYVVKDGEIISFDSKLLHSVSPASGERFVLSWRVIKSQYLSTQLTLFDN